VSAVPEARLSDFCRAVLAAAGADEATAEAGTAAMLHASRLGVDSHGVRLLEHYVRGLEGGRLNPRPQLRLVSERGATAVLEADDAHGALAAYTAMDHAVRIAEGLGVGAVSIRNTSHFGPAGAYAVRAAERGKIGLAVANSDAFMRLHDGAERFHGTNPLAVAVPVGDEDPWLLDMATSAITYNRVQRQKGLGQPLPPGVASTEDGTDAADPIIATMLAPLGGEYGFKGAGLAGLVEILSVILAGMRLDRELLPMGGPDFATPRGLGAFVLALNPSFFAEPNAFAAGMRHYRDSLRASAARPGAAVLAPGDREWTEGRRRRDGGIPLDPETSEAFARLAARYALSAPT
jgi:LDH2 family malate/lactate/ureidoglycolate dehydrogenase